MSEMTLRYFLKLHLKQMKSNLIEYQKGYEYAKQSVLLNSIDSTELIDALRSYVDIGVKYKNYSAYGHAQAIRDLIWEQHYRTSKVVS